MPAAFDQFLQVNLAVVEGGGRFGFGGVVGAGEFGRIASDPHPPSPAPSLRVLVYNIKHGQGMDGVVDLSRAAAVIREHDPDIVALQEVDRGCARTDGVHQATWLGEQTGMEAYFGPFMEYDGGEYGMAMLSRLPVLDATNHLLPPGAEPRTALALQVGLGGEELVVVGIHLYRTERERTAQAGRLVDLYGDESAPVLLAGDFNSRPDSPVVRLLESAWTRVPKRGQPNTFPADEPEREIDFVMLRPFDGWAVERMRVIDEPLVSDHRPLIFEARLLAPGP